MYKWLKRYFIGKSMDQLDSIHDLSRLNLLFNLAFAVSLMGLSAIIISAVIGTYPVFIPAFGNLIFGVTTLYIIRLTGSFINAAKFYLIILFLLIFGNLNFNEGTMHIGVPYWIMLLNILVLYIIGVRWGIAFLFCSLISYWAYLTYVFPHHITLVEDLSPETYYSVYYEAAFALSLLGFIIFTILKSSKASDSLLKKKNAELILQNNEILHREDEKTIMLKEIHHRVKNNLQVITSLLRLQMHELDSKTEAAKFKDSINRVMTMALIHDKMYQTEELSRINLEDYFKGLSEDLMNSYQIDFKVDLSFEFKIEKIGLKSIVPLALIYNELFSNSLKHAFTATEKAEIKVSLSKYSDSHFQFTYEDNGVWKESKGTSTFGRELIESLTDQLDGELEFTSTPKTKYIFKFKHLDL